MKMHFSQSSLEDITRDPRITRDSILEDIAKTQFALETAFAGFDNVTDPDLIDCYIYEMNSAMKRYKYLLEQAANMNLLPKTESPELESNPKPSIYSLIG